MGCARALADAGMRVTVLEGRGARATLRDHLRHRLRPAAGPGVAGGGGRGNDTAPTGQRATVEAAIRRYVRQHACDRDLDAVGIARALGWSARFRCTSRCR
nr:hypothetical protein OH820_06025 [Streptomyces sp. NBC_00857]